MSTRDKLSQLSDDELEKIYQEKKAEYDQKILKNRRIRGILSRKINEKQKSVENLRKEADDFLTSHPELSVAKQDFDDTDFDPEELKQLIQEKQTILSQLQSKKLEIEKSIPEITNHIKQQKLLENQYQEEINLLISQSENFSESDSFEMLELDQLSHEIKSAQDELESLSKGIEELRNKVHQQG
ncbi:MAG: hypothetical protein JSW11_16215 [Candidatus Heimdallarchaeota archaeon]|nr:MAG: hypothetical protein JSW11_16215 [Candidatus Heimdallarchaeota archaeon]